MCRCTNRLRSNQAQVLAWMSLSFLLESTERGTAEHSVFVWPFPSLVMCLFKYFARLLIRFVFSLCFPSLKTHSGIGLYCEMDL